MVEPQMLSAMAQIDLSALTSSDCKDSVKRPAQAARPTTIITPGTTKSASVVVHSQSCMDPNIYRGNYPEPQHRDHYQPTSRSILKSNSNGHHRHSSTTTLSRYDKSTRVQETRGSQYKKARFTPQHSSRMIHGHDNAPVQPYALNENARRDEYEGAFTNRPSNHEDCYRPRPRYNNVPEIRAGNVRGSRFDRANVCNEISNPLEHEGSHETYFDGILEEERFVPELFLRLFDENGDSRRFEGYQPPIQSSSWSTFCSYLAGMVGFSWK